MPKKTEDELRLEIQEEYSFEEGDERIDKILEVKKDRYTATQAKKKAQEEAENLLKAKEHYKSKAEPKGDKGKELPSSLKDIRALNNVEDDDLDKVLDYAEKFHNGSSFEALKDEDLQAILKNRKEVRKTAEATNTGKGKRGSGKINGEALLEKAEKENKLPENDDEIDALIDARIDSQRPQT